MSAAGKFGGYLEYNLTTLLGILANYGMTPAGYLLSQGYFEVGLRLRPVVPTSDRAKRREPDILVLARDI